LALALQPDQNQDGVDTGHNHMGLYIYLYYFRLLWGDPCQALRSGRWPPHITFYPAWVFWCCFFFLGTARVLSATAAWLPQRREGLDKGTIPGGRFPKGGHMQGLGLLASFQGAW